MPAYQYDDLLDITIGHFPEIWFSIDRLIILAYIPVTRLCMFIVRFCDCNTCIISIIVWRSNNLFSILSWMSPYVYFHVWLYGDCIGQLESSEVSLTFFTMSLLPPKQGITVPIQLSRQLKFWTTLSCRLNAHNEPRVFLACLGDRK